MINGDLLGERARLTPDKTALVLVPQGTRFTYAELDARAALAASMWLHVCGFRPGDRVALLAHNRIEFLDLFFAAAKSGIILVPLGTRLTAHEIAYIVRDAGVRAFVYDGAFASTVNELRQSVSVERWIALDEPAAASDSPFAALLPPASGPLPRPAARRHLLPALHQRDNGQAEGRDGAAPHGQLERLQHGPRLAASRRRRQPRLHAAVPRRGPRRVPDAHHRHRRDNRPARGLRRRGDLEDHRAGALHRGARRPDHLQAPDGGSAVRDGRPVVGPVADQRRRSAAALHHRGLPAPRRGLQAGLRAHRGRGELLRHDGGRVRAEEGLDRQAADVHAGKARGG